jgi:hypothetical protein
MVCLISIGLPDRSDRFVEIVKVSGFLHFWLLHWIVDCFCRVGDPQLFAESHRVSRAVGDLSRLWVRLLLLFFTRAFTRRRFLFTRTIGCAVVSHWGGLFLGNFFLGNFAALVIPAETTVSNGFE